MKFVQCYIVKLILKLNIFRYVFLQFQDFGCNCTNWKHPDCYKTLGLIGAPACSLFNHSCVENVNRIYCRDGNIMLFSTRPIKKNEQV